MVVPGCLALGWWQATRALSGNTLSWAYTFEWPVFAGYALFMWWKLLRLEPEEGGGRAPTAYGAFAPAASAAAESVGVGDGGTEQAVGTRTDFDASEEDEELAEYNAYLAALGASGRRKRW